MFGYAKTYVKSGVSVHVGTPPLCNSNPGYTQKQTFTHTMQYRTGV